MNTDYLNDRYNDRLDNDIKLNNNNNYYCDNIIKDFKLKCKIKGNHKTLIFPSDDKYQESQIDNLILNNVEQYEKYIGNGEYKKRIYEIPSSDIKLKSKKWTTTIEGIEEYCMNELLNDNEKVSIELLNMLIYDSQSNQSIPIKISTDINHNDNEIKRNKNVFGKLYLILPSDHNGGEFIINNGASRIDKPIKISLLQSVIGNNNFKYIAFKDNCNVDIESISYGYIVCLVFNLLKNHKREYLYIEKPINKTNNKINKVKQINNNTNI